MCTYTECMMFLPGRTEHQGVDLRGKPCEYASANVGSMRGLCTPNGIYIYIVRIVRTQEGYNMQRLSSVSSVAQEVALLSAHSGADSGCSQ